MACVILEPKAPIKAVCSQRLLEFQNFYNQPGFVAVEIKFSESLDLYIIPYNEFDAVLTLHNAVPQGAAWQSRYNDWSVLFDPQCASMSSSLSTADYSDVDGLRRREGGRRRT